VHRTGLVLWHKPNSVPAFARWRSFISLGFPSAQPGAGCDYYPRVLPAFAGKAGRQPSLCFVLHHMGFFVRLRLRECPVGSYPAFSPLPNTTRPTQPFPAALSALAKNRSAVLILPESCTGWAWVGRVVPGGIFSVTLSVTQDFASRVPPISRGMPPFGVRTFLWQNKGQASDHPPQLAK
jgi:hypothetical protein